MKSLNNHKYILIIALMLIIVVGAITVSNPTLQVTNQELTSSKLTEPIRILQLTDLHNAEFGVNNTKLIAKCEEQHPDIILMTGDLINMNEPDTDVATDLIAALTEIAPVYVSLGNHEIANQENFGTDCRSIFEEAGAF